MNTHTQSDNPLVPSTEGDSPGLDAALFDRLVEGKLDESTRRELLLRCEREPDGWRRCALAFLEQQALAEALQAWANHSLESRLCVQASRLDIGDIQRAKAILPVVKRLLIAACIVLGFLAGWTAQRSASTAARHSAPILSHGGIGSESRSADQVVNATLDSMPPIGATNSTQPPRAHETRIAPLQKAALALLPPNPAGLSAIERVSFQPPVLSDAQRTRLERGGFHVHQRPGVATVRLDDGKQVSFPVEEIQVRYVGSLTY